MEEFCEGTFEKPVPVPGNGIQFGQPARQEPTNDLPPHPRSRTESKPLAPHGNEGNDNLVSSKHRAIETHIWSPREIEPMGLAPWIWPAGGRDDNNKRGQPELRGVNIWMGQLMKRTTTAPGSRPVPSQRKLRGGRRRGGEDEGGQPASTETQDALSPDGAA